MPTLIATPGADDANSYATVAEANTYHEAHLYMTAWENADDDNKVIALIWATRLLDEQNDWIGEKASAAQALRWPRSYAEDADGYPIDAATIPQKLKEATAELARHLLVKDRLQVMDDNVAGLESVKAGSVEVSFSSMDRIDLLPPSVDQMLKNLVAGGSSGGMIVPLRRA